MSRSRKIHAHVTLALRHTGQAIGGAQGTMAGGARNWARALIGGSVIIGGGYLLMICEYLAAAWLTDAATTPTEQQLYDVRYSARRLSLTPAAATGPETASGCAAPGANGGGGVRVCETEARDGAWRAVAALTTACAAPRPVEGELGEVDWAASRGDAVSRCAASE